ncbi:MAG: hypothetical protein R3247_07880 [Rhodothermales bacterium]|nr:hypothetical protein [Rhodothermales bacterium]
MKYLLPVLLLLLGCAEGSSAETDTPAPQDPTDAGLPATVTDTMFVEGTAQPVTLRRYDAPGIPFTTALPDGDFRPAVLDGTGGQEVRFIAAFGQAEQPDAYVAFLFPAVEGAGALHRAVQDTLAARGWQPTEHDDPERTAPCPWADGYHTYRDEGEVLSTGYACLGEHGGQPFALITHVPVPYSEGFGPRLALLLEHFRWRDTGAPLAGRS